MDNNEEKSQIRPFWQNIINWCKARCSREEFIETADVAYARSTYGNVVTAEDIIKMHQQQINRIIKDKQQYRTGTDSFSDYRCVYSFPDNTKEYINDILAPFIEKKYTVINLSEKVDELKDSHVYLISWYKDSI